MRVLLVSDLHYALPHFDWVLEQSPDFDLVVLAGDQLDLSSSVPLESQIVVIRTYAARISQQTSVVMCSGNHDLTARNQHDEKNAPWIEAASQDGVACDWTTIDEGDIRVTVCPWWDGPKTRNDVDALLANDAETRPRRWLGCALAMSALTRPLSRRSCTTATCCRSPVGYGSSTRPGTRRATCPCSTSPPAL